MNNKPQSSNVFLIFACDENQRNGKQWYYSLELFEKQWYSVLPEEQYDS